MKHAIKLSLLVLLVGVTWVRANVPRSHYTLRYVTSSGYPQRYYGLEFSPNSAQLAMSVGGNVDLINVPAGRINGQLKGYPFSLTYTQSGDKLYMISSSKGVLIDTRTRSELTARHDRQPGLIGVTIDKQAGKLLFVAVDPSGPLAKVEGIGVGDELVGVGEGPNGRISSVTGRSVQDVIKRITGPAGTYLRLKILPHGVFGEEHAKTVLLRRQPVRVQNGRPQFVPFSETAVQENVAWCIVSERHEFRSAATGTPFAHIVPIDVQHKGQYAISPDQSRFAIVAPRIDDRSKNAVEVYDIATQQRICYVPMRVEGYSDICFMPDNNRVLVATWNTIQMVDTDRGELSGAMHLGARPKNGFAKNAPGGLGSAAMIAAMDDFAYSASNADKQLAHQIAVSSKGIVAVSNAWGGVSLWDPDQDVMLLKLPKNPEVKADAVKFSPDGGWLAYHIQGVLHLVDVSDIEPTPVPIGTPVLAAAAQVTDQEKAEPATRATPANRVVTKPVTSEPRELFAVGERVEALWDQVWLEAEIVGKEGPDHWRVHYTGYSEDWDETVKAKRIRRGG